MILRNEILKKSEEWDVPPATVDKDWVLGHFLSAFFQHGENIASVVFKGGTCLRKCYFPDYRFSEDLDFTASEHYHLTSRLLEEVVNNVQTHSGIKLYAEPVKELKHKEKRMGDSAKIWFWGANHSKNSPPPEDPKRWHHSIKLEITTYEKQVFEPMYKHVHHPFSDSLLSPDSDIPCYDLREIMAEKIRALIQRSYTAPRDYFDIWNIQKEFREDDWSSINDAFHQKMEFKGYQYSGVEQLIDMQGIEHVRKAWTNSLSHQIPGGHIPDVDLVVGGLRDLLADKLVSASS